MIVCVVLVALRLATVMEPMRLSSTPYIRGSFRVMWALGKRGWWRWKDASLNLFHEPTGLLTRLLSQMPSYNAWQRIEMSRRWMDLKQ